MKRADLLVIDDEFSVLYTIKAILETQFSSIATFTEPREGLEFLAQKGCRVLITDLRMPEIDGVEVLRRALAVDPDIQVIMLTAHGSEKVAVEALKMGAFHYITKPFDHEELNLLVRKALDQYAFRKRIQYDTDMARSLQQNLLPTTTLSGDRFRLSACYIPGGTVGGDYYDYQFLPGDALGIIVADAAGHGVSSAMMMAMLKMAFLNAAPGCSRPASLLAMINQTFLPILKGRTFFTAFYGILQPKPLRLTFASAGHPFPLFLRPAEARFLESDLSGPAIGLFHDAEYTDTQLPLEAGDRLLFYTDGLPDLDDTGAFFEEFRNQFRQLAYSNQSKPLDVLCQSIAQQHPTHPDDITMVLLEI
jgi:serine phosphatase RsbU (regulator of sigma subunit)